MDKMQELQSHIDQIKALGVDLQTLQAAYKGNGTSLGLNQWQHSDKPTMADFNRDNEILDREIRALREELANKANVQRPIMYPLPLSTGFVEGFPCYYFKTQEGVVTIYGTVDKENYINAGEIIAIMPEGFRIETTVEYPITCISGSTFYPASLRVWADGRLESRIVSANVNRAYFMISYISNLQ